MKPKCLVGHRKVPDTSKAQYKARNNLEEEGVSFLRTGDCEKLFRV